MSDLLTSASFVIPASVFVAGVIGSPHCMSMCGPLVLNFAESKSALGMYQLGRMIAYTSAGALLGAFGQSLLGAQKSDWTAVISLFVISILLFFNGYRTLKNRPLHFPVPAFFTRLSMQTWRKVMQSNLPKSMSAFIAGLCTVLLPCGHLYAFLLGAAATGRAWGGAGFMFAFWLGSTPLLSFGTLALRRVIQKSPVRARHVAGGLMVAAGVFSVLTFGARSFEIYQAKTSAQAAPIENHPPHCH